MKWRLIVFLLFVSLNIFYPQELIFAVGEWPPYTNLSESGLATDIVKAACKSVGLEYRIIHVSWLRAERIVEKGEAFATFPYAITKERQEKYIFSDPIISSSNSIIFKSSNTHIDISQLRNIESFRYYTIGMTTGSDALAIPLRNIGAKVETTETVDLSMKKLKSGRIDFLIEDSYVINELLRKYHDETIIMLNNKTIFLGRQYCLMVTKNQKNNNEIIALFNSGIKKIKSTGEYKRIVDKYQE